MIVLIPFFSTMLWAAQFDLTHATWTAWLKKHATVVGPVTTLNYKMAKQEPGPLNAYVGSIESITKAQYDGWSEKDRLAFLINAYNALTVKWIVQNYPVKSIKDTGNLFSSAWKKKFFKLFGEEGSLDGIEHGIIRKEFKEPRIHFAVVCASKGCPALRGEAYVGSRLDDQLESGARSFLSDANRNRFEAPDTLHLSKIFDWYGDDFKMGAGSIQNFVATRLNIDDRKVAAGEEFKVKFLDYDWSLNETP